MSAAHIKFHTKVGTLVHIGTDLALKADSNGRKESTIATNPETECDTTLFQVAGICQFCFQECKYGNRAETRLTGRFQVR